MTPPQHGIFAEADEIKFEGDAMPADSIVSRVNEQSMAWRKRPIVFALR